MLIGTRFANTPQIHRVATPGGARRQITFFAEPVRSASYDPAAGDFIIYGRDVGGGEFSQLYRMDLADGRSTLLTDGGRSQNAISAWSPDDRHFAYVSTRRNGTDRDIHIMDPRNPASSRLVCENRGGGWSVTDWSPDGNTLLVLERISVNESHLWLADVATGAKSELTSRSQDGISRTSGRFSKDGMRVYFATDEGNEFKRLAILKLGTGETTSLTSGIDHDVTGVSLSRDGRRIVFSADRLGIAIIYPNVRGSTGFGKTFVALDNGRLRENSVRDIGALLDWIAQQPDLDASRVMITGGSYGGYMTLACAVRYNDRIRCSLDVVGISNFVTFLENTESYRRDLRRAEYGDERDPEMCAFLESIAPLNHAAKIRKPIFVVQGANDPRVPRTEALQMVASIREAGGQVCYMEAANEGHGFAKKVNSDYQFYSTVQFIRTHLLE